MGYSLCMMADFQNGLISQIFSVFLSGFFHRTTVKHLSNGLCDAFWRFQFLTQSENFAWTIAFA